MRRVICQFAAASICMMSLSAFGKSVDWAGKVGGRSIWLSTEDIETANELPVLWGGSSPVPSALARSADGRVTLTKSYSHPDHPDWAWTRTLSFVPSAGDSMECVFFETRANRPGKDVSATGTVCRLPPLPPRPDLGAVKYGEPINLLKNGLDGFDVLDNGRASQWRFADGVLENGGSGANIRTKRGDFTDFKLSYDVRADKDCNSGVYLRGIYEIQTIDSYGKAPDSHNMGAVYGRATPVVTADRPAGEWQHVDATLCDRHATVVLNGVKIIDNVPLRGVTGGALSPDQFAPGPIVIQGDHNGGAYRNMLLSPIQKKSECHGSQDVVRVSDFGYDAEDSTRFLQSAIDSGAKKVVIDSRRWVTLPLRGRSNQEIFFEDGAVVEAKKGAYLDKDDCVFVFPGCSNVVIGGKGTIRMHHDDYLKPPYAKAEWRHAINFCGTAHARAWGLRILESGGDGIYVGGLGKINARRYGLAEPIANSADIRLHDLYIDTNVRQGMSVTGVDGLIAERCTFKNTWGLPPQAGVDFEPNQPQNLMRGIVMRDCLFENNKGFGIELALGHNEPGKSAKFDMRFYRCRTVGNMTGVTVHNTRPDHTEIEGSLVFRDCSFEHPRGTALAINATPKCPFSCEMTRCRIVESRADGSDAVREIDGAWMAENVPFAASGALVPKHKPRPDFALAKVVDAAPGRMAKLSQIRFRNHSRFVFYADRARNVRFKWKQSPFGRYGKQIAGNAEFCDQVGRILSAVPLPGKDPEELSFAAPAAGFYFLDANHKRLQLTLLECDAPVAVDLSDDWCNAIASTGDLYFSVPEKAPKFGFFVSGDGGEAIGVEVFSPSGRSVYRRPSVFSWQGHVEPEGAEAGLWKAVFSRAEKGAFEDWALDLTGLAGHVFLSPEKYWTLPAEPSRVFTSEELKEQVALEYAIPDDGFYEICGQAEDFDKIGDGVVVTLGVGDVTLDRRFISRRSAWKASARLSTHLRRMRKGDRVQMLVDPLRTTDGDVTSLRLDVRKAQASAPKNNVVADRFSPVPFLHTELGGLIDERVMSLIKNHYMKLNLENRWLRIFREREEMLETNTRPGWRYEGVGKLLDAASLFSVYSCDTAVAARTRTLFESLSASMDDNGYIGFFKVRPDNAQQYRNWTFHEQEYLLLGFIRNYLCTGNPRALASARRLADYFMKVFPTVENGIDSEHPARKINTGGFPEPFLLLYGLTGDRRYLAFASDTPHGSDRDEIRHDSLRKWRQGWDEWPNHVYVMTSRTYAQTELYRIDGDTGLMEMSKRLHDAFYGIEGGAYILGSVSRDEHFTRDQRGDRYIVESCATAYLLRWLDSMLRLEGDFANGDRMERAIYNALFAAMSPDGSKIRCALPFSGERQYDPRGAGFCCCGNFRRAVAELPQKVAYVSADGMIAVNLYAPFEKKFDIGEESVVLKCETDYPTSGEVKFTVLSDVFVPLAFRIPIWSQAESSWSVNGSPEGKAVPDGNGLLVLKREWKKGDVVRLSFPMRWRLVRGRCVQRGRVALMRGPVLFCVGKDQNQDVVAKYENLKDLWLDATSIGETERDDSVRRNGVKVRARAWPDIRRKDEMVNLVFTEFVDPSGRETYFRSPVYVDDELFDREASARW